MIYILGVSVFLLGLACVSLVAYVVMLRIELIGAHDQIDDSAEHNAELRSQLRTNAENQEIAVSMLLADLDEADQIHRANMQVVWV